MNELRIVPTLHLRGIVPSVILARYKKGDFPGVQESKVNVSVTDIRLLPKFSSDPAEETFIFVDKSGSKNVYTTTNQASYRQWMEKGAYSPNVPCQWCRYPVGDECVPIPLKMVDRNLFIGDVPYCSFECSLAGLKKEYGLSFITRDPLYRNSEYLLKHLFSKENPGKKLKEAMDWRLLDINGGPLSREEFASSFHFLRTPNLIIPAKVCYLQMNKS